MIANNDQLVDERTCDYDPEKPTECITETNEWVTETGNWPPGIVYLEVIATDRLGEASSQRFWVNIPYTPPPDPEAEEPPRFSDILRFREEFGLDLDLKGDELAINDRVFELMGDWNNPLTPAGEVARATDSDWGVPLRAADVAELEYRQRYVEQASVDIPAWASGNASASYAGYYVDHRAGGMVHVGFTDDQVANVEGLRDAGISVPAERLVPFVTQPQYLYSELLSLQGRVAAEASKLPSFTRASIDLQRNRVMIGTTATVESMTAALNSVLGGGIPVEAFHDANPPTDHLATSREILTGRIRAGERIANQDNGECTAGFGTWLESAKLHGEAVHKHFLLTAAHCGGINNLFSRQRETAPYEWETAPIGRVRRTGFEGWGPVDAAAILLQGDAKGWAPRQIYLAEKLNQPIKGIVAPVPGMIVKTSGATTDEVLTGEVVGPLVPVGNPEPPVVKGVTWVNETWEVPISLPEKEGDSGGPVWQANSGNVIGLWNAGSEPSYVTPLLPMQADSAYESIGPLAPGALAKLGFNPGNLSMAP